MNIGDAVMVPRTGGGESPGKITELWGDRARVEFRVGEIYRGKPAPARFQNATGHKTVLIKDLKPIKED